MKKIFLLIISAFLLFGCGHTNATTEVSEESLDIKTLAIPLTGEEKIEKCEYLVKHKSDLIENTYFTDEKEVITLLVESLINLEIGDEIQYNEDIKENVDEIILYTENEPISVQLMKISGQESKAAIITGSKLFEISNYKAVYSALGKFKQG